MQAAAAKTKTGGRLNAFELLNSALDISAIFEHKDDVVTRRTRFTSMASTHDLLAALQQSTKDKGGTVHVQGSDTSWCDCLWGVVLWGSIGRQVVGQYGISFHDG